MNKNSLGGVSRARYDPVQISCSVPDYTPRGHLFTISCSIGGQDAWGNRDKKLTSAVFAVCRRDLGLLAWHRAICCVSHISLGVTSNGAQVELPLILFCSCLNTGPSPPPVTPAFCVLHKYMEPFSQRGNMGGFSREC